MPTPTQTLMQVLVTEQTCGEACWKAHEDICRCSCGGRNHGCLRTESGEQPARTRRIGAAVYRLAAVATHNVGRCLNEIEFGIRKQARVIEDESVKRGEFATSDFWHRSDKRNWPCVLKTASEDEVKRWPELATWRDMDPWRPLMLWVRADLL